jgi:hypothetical protein
VSGKDRDIGLSSLTLGAATGWAGVFMNHQPNAIDAGVRLKARASDRGLGLAQQIGAALRAASGGIGGMGVAATAGLHAQGLPGCDGIVAGNSLLST